MKSYKDIINSFIVENDIGCIPDIRGNVWFELEDVVKSLRLNIEDFIDKIEIVCYTLDNRSILFISRKTMQFLITQSRTKYSREIFRSSYYKYKWYK